MTTETKEVREKYDVTIQRRATELCESLGITDVKQIALITASSGVFIPDSFTPCLLHWIVTDSATASTFLFTSTGGAGRWQAR